MTDKELEQKAEEYTNHLQAEMLVYCPENPRGRRTPTLQEQKITALCGIKLKTSFRLTMMTSSRMSQFP